MIKIRDARYCNLKLFLIFFIIYGHLIEPGTSQSETLRVQYKLLYLIHMPLFSFLSGLFLKDESACRTQLLRLAPLYIVLQGAAVLLGDGKVRPSTPYWHLWYLLSSSCWVGLAWLWFRFCKKKGRFLFLTGSLLLGCAAGLIPSIGRKWSLSRTLVFLPYFWAGLICPPSLSWKKLRPWGLAALSLALVLLFFTGKQLPATFLYHASPYSYPPKGVLLRLDCYLISGSLGLFLLCFIPGKRFPFTKAGANTMPAYLLHAPLVLHLREQRLSWPVFLLTTAVFLYVTYSSLQWHGKLYAIIPTERRG